MRDRRSWLATLPLAAIFIGLGVVSVKHEVGFAVVCFLAAVLLVVPGIVSTVLDHAVDLTGIKRRVAMTILGTLALILVGGMFIAMVRSGNRPPGSP